MSPLVRTPAKPSSNTALAWRLCSAESPSGRFLVAGDTRLLRPVAEFVSARRAADCDLNSLFWLVSRITDFLLWLKARRRKPFFNFSGCCGLSGATQVQLSLHARRRLISQFFEVLGLPVQSLLKSLLMFDAGALDDHGA